MLVVQTITAWALIPETMRLCVCHVWLHKTNKFLFVLLQGTVAVFSTGLCNVLTQCLLAGFSVKDLAIT